ncbi:MAG: hypothetical protein OXJ37_16650 [Bryobacterales bacterium]|nr:hypothetical protein [Bryobacterales bacterium]
MSNHSAEAEASPERQSVRGAVLEYLALHKPAVVGRPELLQIRRHVLAHVKRPKPPSDRYLLSILLETNVEVDRAIGGLPVDLRTKIPVSDLSACKQSLVELARQYCSAADPSRASDVRRVVRRTKDHLDLALKRARSPNQLSAQRETFRWLAAWLENPTVFEAWVEVREQSRARQAGPMDGASDPATGN